jgi:hypothetical protein
MEHRGAPRRTSKPATTTTRVTIRFLDGDELLYDGPAMRSEQVDPQRQLRWPKLWHPIGGFDHITHAGRDGVVVGDGELTAARVIDVAIVPIEFVDGWTPTPLFD